MPQSSMSQAATSQPGPETNARDRLFILTSIILSLLLAALDQTIVATAGPAIQQDLQIQTSLYTWLTIAYLVASTVVVPIYGKLSDIYGRKPIMMIGLSIFLIGSLLCGLAWNATALIVFRSLQGLGAGALLTTAFAIVADLYPPAERGRINGLLGGVIGVSSVLGPLVGGAITDWASWHWVFFVNLPLGAVALSFIIWRMPFVRPAKSRVRVDYAGALWLVVSVIPLLIGLSLGKSNPQPGETAFAWGSWQMFLLLGLFLFGLVAFIITERRAEDPLLDLSLFRNRTFAVGTLASFVLGAGFLSAIVYLPLFMVNVVGLSATLSGLTTTPLTFGLIVSSLISGQLTTRFRRYKTVMLVSLVVLFIGFIIMGFTLTPTSGQLEVSLKMVIVGLGLGSVVSLYSLAVQNALPPDKAGVATSSVSFFQQMGSTVGLAVLGTVFAASLSGGLERRIPEALATAPSTLQAQFAQTQTAAPEGSFSTAALAESLEQTYSAQAATLTNALQNADVAAAQTLLSDPQMTPQLKGVLELVVGGQASEQTRAAALQDALQTLEQNKVASQSGVERLGAAFKQTFTDAMRRIYQIGAVIVLLGFIISMFLPDSVLRNSNKTEMPAGFV